MIDLGSGGLLTTAADGTVDILLAAVDYVLRIMSHRGRQKDVTVMHILFDALTACNQEYMQLFVPSMAYACHKQVSDLCAECHAAAIAQATPSWHVSLWRLISGAMDEYTIGQSILIERLLLVTMYYRRALRKASPVPLETSKDLEMACSLVDSWFAQVYNHRQVFITLLLASAKDSGSTIYRTPREVWGIIFRCTMHDLTQITNLLQNGQRG